MSALLLPLCTFHRVFDTVPVQEVVTLPELVASLRRFALRPEVLARGQREVGRIRRSASRAKAGLHASGRHAAKFAKAAEAAKREGRDPAAAIDALSGSLEQAAHKDAKRDLRIWSPTLYRPGADKRGASYVTHLSCLVLDYDDGTSIAEASAAWSAWFHVVHSTWSHLDSQPRFRVVLPLAQPVPSERWAAVWAWAADRSAGQVDPALKSPASTYALPAVPHENWPREALSRPGAILDPVLEGVLSDAVSLSLSPQRPSDGAPSLFRGEHPDEQHLDHLDETALYFVDDAFEDDHWAPDPLPEPLPRSTEAPAVEAPAVESSAVEPSAAEAPTVEPSAPAAPTIEPSAPAAPQEPAPLEGDLERVLGLLETLERRFSVHPLVEGLERLASMREAGALTQKEFREAKRALLAEP